MSWRNPAAARALSTPNRLPKLSASRSERRHLHRRRRPAHCVGRALSPDERQAHDSWVLLARLDGQCHAQAIGAQDAFPGRQVVSLSGDGGFAMLMGDLLSLVQLDLPVKIVIFNNGSLGYVELEQKATGFLSYGTDLINPNFAAMAQAVGIRGIRLTNLPKSRTVSQQLSPMMARLLSMQL